VTGESEWVTGDKEQGARVGTPFMGQISIPKPDPPSLEEYLFRLFHEHDVDDSGDCSTEELFHLIQGLGLGLSEEEVQSVVAAADANGNGKVEWEEFLPVGVAHLEEIFDTKNWDEHDTPYVKLYDEMSRAWYFFNRETGEQEWVDGTTAQANRVGIHPTFGGDESGDGGVQVSVAAVMLNSGVQVSTPATTIRPFLHTQCFPSQFMDDNVILATF